MNSFSHFEARNFLSPVASSVLDEGLGCQKGSLFFVVSHPLNEHPSLEPMFGGLAESARGHLDQHPHLSPMPDPYFFFFFA